MKNKFYSDYDFLRFQDSSREKDYRTDFQIDRDRIIHSSEFRRLQGKTQVFLPGEYDFYRTRLTHSIEVAQIGRSICNFLRKSDEHLNEEYFIDADLVEAACLTHDLGHPPFGHAGERTLNKLMAPYGGFEGNAQTLRLLTKIFYTTENFRRGMNGTRAFLDSILKYKSLYSQLENPENHFLYDDQEEILAQIFERIDLTGQFKPGYELNKFQSIECQIMDWADDTAYAINDLVDSISGGFLTVQKLENWKEENGTEFSDKQIDIIDEIISIIKQKNFKRIFGAQIGEFIISFGLKEKKTFLDDKTNRYKYELETNDEICERVTFYKRISVELVFRSAQLHQMELKGDMMIRSIFKVLEDNYVNNLSEIKLLPDFSDRIVREEKDKTKRARLICDYIAGMTDTFAMRIYKRLFDPDYSSFINYA